VLYLLGEPVDLAAKSGEGPSLRPVLVLALLKQLQGSIQEGQELRRQISRGKCLRRMREVTGRVLTFLFGKARIRNIFSAFIAIGAIAIAVASQVFLLVVEFEGHLSLDRQPVWVVAVV